MISRPALPVRSLAATAVCAAALAVTACSGGGSGSPAASAGAAGAPAAGGAVSPARALSLAASRSRQVTSFRAAMDIVTSGAYASHLTGTLAEQTKPALAADAKFAVTAAGTAVPGGMETLLTGDAVYLRLSSLAHMLGKPWIKIPFSGLKSSPGADFEPLIRQLQASNPLSMAQLLPAAAHVRQAGHAVINGVATTEYTGTLTPAKAITRLGPGLRSALAPALASTGIQQDAFTVWVDGQHQIRKLVQVQTGSRYRATSTMVVLAVNVPVPVQVPPASQTAGVPGL